MNLKRTVLVGATIATVSLGGGGLALAATDTSSTSNSSGVTSIVDKIASKFNLNKADVQAVFDENRQAHETEMKADQAERLAKAVTEGDLTQEQADHITAALKEIDTLRGDTVPGDLSDEVEDQIHDKMDTLRDWADDNDIDMRFVMGGHGGHGGRGFGGSDGRHSGDDGTSDQGSGDSSSTSS